MLGRGAVGSGEKTGNDYKLTIRQNRRFGLLQRYRCYRFCSVSTGLIQ
jgi:hypothetical protein